MTKMKLAAVFVLLFATSAFAYHLPKPAGYVNDFANILTGRQVLEEELRAYEKNTTIEIAVVTLSELPHDQTLFSYGVELFQEWGIGKKGEDNGILVLINANGTTGNRLRVELGYGVQGYITGAEAGRILDSALPYYENGDYDGAAVEIIAGLEDELAGYMPGQRQQDVFNYIPLPIMIYFFVFFLFIIISLALRNRCPYCFGRLECKGDNCTCKKCGRKVNKKKRFVPVLIGSGGHGGGGGGGGGFGGGGSGGGGAGR